jgi:hypothetical protein
VSEDNQETNKEYLMTSVSARSYVAAGLATAIAGVAVASPVLAQSNIHLPTISGDVELASEVSSVAQHAVSTGTIEVKQITDAVRHVVASAPHEAATAATDLAGGPLVKKAAVTAVARAVTAVVAANQASAPGGVTVHRDSASSPAVSAALPGLPNLQGILGVPFLVLDIPVDIAQSTFQALSDASFGLSGVLFGLGVGDQDLVQDGLDEIASSLPDNISQAVSNVQADVDAIAHALGFNFDAADRAALASVAKVADVKNPGAVAVAKPDDVTKPDATKPDATKDTTPEATKPDTTKDTTPETTKSDTTKADTKGTTPEATKAADTKDTTPEATKAADTKDTTPEATKAADTKPDTAKPSNHSSTTEHHTGAATVKNAGDKGATKAGASANNGHTPGTASHAGGAGAKHSAGAGAGAKKGGAKGGK